MYLAPDGIYQKLNIAVLDAEPYMIWHVIGAGLLLFGIEHSKSARKVLAGKAFIWLGRNSYSLYLSHIAVIATVGTGVALHLLQGTGLQFEWVALISLAATLLVLIPLSALFYRFVEQPCGKVAANLFAPHREIHQKT